MLRVTAVNGGPHARGWALGQAMGGEIRAFLANAHGRTDALRGAPLTSADLAAILARHVELVERHAPDLAEEVRGLAAGARVSQWQAWLLQFRRELSQWPPLDCSTLALGGADPVLGQTVDLAGHMGEWIHLLHVSSLSAPSALLLSFVGLLGYLGLNSAGLAVGINMVTSDDWQPGISPYLLVRKVLSCTHIDEAVEMLQRLPRASSRCFTLVDREGAQCVEMTARGLRRLDSPMPLSHTNHFLDPELMRSERMKPLEHMESRRRLARLRELARGLPADAGRDAVAHLLTRPGLQKGPASAPSELETVATVVMEPRRGALWVRVANDWEVHHV